VTGVLYVVSGPSGVGKSSIINGVVNRVRNLSFSVSCTTRPKRPAEQDGKDYFFIDEYSFRQMIENGEFLEWAQVHGYLYGTPRSFVEQELKKACGVILDIDVQGAISVMERYPDAVYIFIAPPSFDALKKRLHKRGTESAVDLQKRLQDAKKELSFIPKFQYVIVNEKLTESVHQLASIIVAEQLKVSRMIGRMGLHKYFGGGEHNNV